MKRLYFKLLIFFSIFALALVSTSPVFASSIVNDNVTVQQDVSALALRDIDTVRNIIANNESLRNDILSISSNDLCYAIIPSETSSSNLNLIVYRKALVIGTGADMNFYGINTTAFYISACHVFYLFRDSNYTRSYSSNLNKPLPSFYYLRSIVELTEGLSSNSSIVSSVDENTNAVKENTEVSKETQNFIKDDSEVDNSSITGMTDSFNDLDDIQDTGSEDVGNIFNLFSNNRNHESDSFSFSVRVPFSNENMNITIDKDLTRNTLLSLCGGRASLQGLVITCINFLWSFLIFKFIVSNLISLIDKIRTGDITNIRTRNVLVDVL